MEDRRETPTHRVIVADDDAGLVDLLRLVLHHSGFEVMVALSSADCLRLAADKPADLFLIDLNLSDGSAFDLIPKLRALPQAGKVPIYLLSGTPLDELERVQLEQLGVEPLLKPISIAVIKQKVERTLEAHPRRPDQ